MHVDYSIKKINDGTILINAKIGDFSKGVLKLNVEKDFSGKFSASSVIISSQPGVGIPRGLLENAVTELSKFAKEKNSSVTHTVLLETDDSIKKIPKILADLGYINKGYAANSLKYERIYE